MTGPGENRHVRDPHDRANGTRFGVVVVTVSADMGDCVLHVDPVGGRLARVPRFHSVEEIEGAITAQTFKAGRDPVAADMVRALRFAAQWMRDRRRG